VVVVTVAAAAEWSARPRAAAAREADEDAECAADLRDVVAVVAAATAAVAVVAWADESDAVKARMKPSWVTAVPGGAAPASAARRGW
jgi:hypothetical protein